MTNRPLVIVFVICMATVQFASPAAAIPLVSEDNRQPVEVSVDGTTQPTWVVDYKTSSDASLEDWAESSSDRKLLSLDNTSGTALVAASTSDIGDDMIKDLLNQGLSNRGYVNAVELNYRVSRTEPVDLTHLSYVEKPKPSRVARYNPLSEAAWSNDGVAYKSDAEATTMADSRSVLGVDNVSQDGTGMTIAVIDTGVNTADGRVFGNGTSGSELRVSNLSKNFISGETIKENGTDAVADGNGHGTWVASSISADTANDTNDGIAPNASLLVLKALDDDGGGSTADIADAIRYAADQDADVISLSLGSPVYSDSLEDAVASARDNGSVVVVAAGNSARTQPVGVASPADVEGAIGVAAVTAEAPENASAAYFSQRSGQVAQDTHVTTDEAVDVAAPGMKTMARTPTESGRVENTTLSGTSMATPMVAASIALSLEAHPGWEPSDVSEHVESTSRRMPNAAAAEVGHGMIAPDRLVDVVNVSESQLDAMDAEAEGRQNLYESLSLGTGTLQARFAKRTGGLV